MRLLCAIKANFSEIFDIVLKLSPSNQKQNKPDGKSNIIKTWDVNVPHAYVGYCGATGNHARAIFDGVQQEAAALIAAGQEAMREACVEEAKAEMLECAQRGDKSGMTAAAHIQSDICALPLPSTPAALARMIAEAEARGMEKAVGIVEAFEVVTCMGGTYSADEMTRDQIAAAIRAAAGEGKP